MEQPQINRIRPDHHDCNECPKCKLSARNNGKNVCETCRFLFFEKLHKDFSSGNATVDDIVKNPIYIPPMNENDSAKFFYYEWIPYDRFKNISFIAKGGFGTIHKATWIDGKLNAYSIKHHGELDHKRCGPQDVAIKFMNNPELSEEIFKEINIERSIVSSNRYIDKISQVIGITQNPKTLDFGFVTCFAEYGDMRKFLSTNSTNWHVKLKIAQSIAEGLVEIHESGMVHRDLHSGNILQYYPGSAIICDLGLCQPANKKLAEKKIFGVVPYIPSEVFRGEEYSTAGDIYSFGMLLWELATLKPPFHNRPHNISLIMDILNCVRPQIPNTIPSCYAELIKKCWDPNPSNRPTAKEAEFTLIRLMNALEYNESTPEVAQFLEAENHVEDICEIDESFISEPIHSEAIYSSRPLSLQTSGLSTEFLYLPEDSL
ncbi:hypothetical protein G9A89_022377 [Geosiphon pyriformis]|nr:hypothetical protein G9A89_022377 [Geosiphon pyriformis]